MFKPATKTHFNAMLHNMAVGNGESVYFLPIAQANDGSILHIVCAYVRGYEADDAMFQRTINGQLYTLCGKVAFNTDDMQHDFYLDWNMPIYDNGAVYDTEVAITGVEDYEVFKSNAQDIVDLLNNGTLHVC